jgi:hypothetical protein
MSQALEQGGDGGLDAWLERAVNGLWRHGGSPAEGCLFLIPLQTKIEAPL